jgi:hypothetical protein
MLIFMNYISFINMEIKALNQYLLQRTYDYLKLPINGIEVQCPYFTNDIGMIFIKILKENNIDSEIVRNIKNQYQSQDIPFGIGSGKGTPEEIVAGFKHIADYYSKNTNNAVEDGIRNFMNVWGLGIDCSGLGYEVFKYAFQKIGEEDQFLKSLNWIDTENMRATRANCSVFDGKASRIIEPKEVRGTDFILIKDTFGGYPGHNAYIVEEDGILKIAQSTPSLRSSGVNLDKFSINQDGLPKFELDIVLGTPWEELYERKLLEFRRLTILDLS